MGFLITFSQGKPRIFHIGSFIHNKLLHGFFFKLMMIYFYLLMMCCFSFLDIWHQWKPNETIFPFLIDGNTHVSLVIMLLLFLSPFDINGKGYFFLFQQLLYQYFFSFGDSPPEFILVLWCSILVKFFFCCP